MAADARQVAQRYFDALARRDLDGAAACWAPDGVDRLIGQSEAHGPEGVRAFFGELFAAVPDWAFEVEAIVAEGDRAAVRWNATGTFAGESSFQGIAPTGGRVRMAGFDLLTVRDGLIVRERRVHRRHGLRAPDRAAAAGGVGRGGEAAARVQRPHARGAQARGHAAPSRSPTASGACAAACRGR